MISARQIGVLFCGRNAQDSADDLVLLAVNAHWEAHDQHLPPPPAGHRWRLAMHTACADPFRPDTPFDGAVLRVDARSVAVFVCEPAR